MKGSSYPISDRLSSRLLSSSASRVDGMKQERNDLFDFTQSLFTVDRAR